MKREVRDKRGELYKNSLGLKKLQFSKELDFHKSQRIKKEQDKFYKKYMFYKGIMDATEKVNKK